MRTQVRHVNASKSVFSLAIFILTSAVFVRHRGVLSPDQTRVFKSLQEGPAISGMDTGVLWTNSMLTWLVFSLPPPPHLPGSMYECLHHDFNTRKKIPDAKTLIGTHPATPSTTPVRHTSAITARAWVHMGGKWRQQSSTARRAPKNGSGPSS